MEATITSALKALKMPGMAESWRVMEETHQLDKLSVREAMPLLLQAEMDNRETNRISKLIKDPASGLLPPFKNWTSMLHVAFRQM